MIINKGKQRNLHWHTNANEWNYYLRGKGQVVLFGSGGRSKVANVAAGDAVYIPAGFGHAIKNTGDDALEIVQTWDNSKFEEIDLDRWVRSSPNYLARVCDRENETDLRAEFPCHQPGGFF